MGFFLPNIPNPCPVPVTKNMFNVKVQWMIKTDKEKKNCFDY